MTVLINSCDKYADAWYPFFRFIDLFGGDLKQYPFAIAAERKDFSYDGLDVRVLHYRTNRPWGERLLAEVSHIETEFIFFVIEDFFLLKPLDNELFRVAMDYMENNPDVGFMNVYNKGDESIDKYEFREIDPNVRRIYVNTSIWRKSYFISLLRKHESIWDFERYSCFRARNLPFRCVLFAANHPCYYYHQPSAVSNGNAVRGGGYGIVRGKWLPSNVELFKKYDIDVDFSRLGFYEPSAETESKEKEDAKPTLLEKLALKNKLFKKVDNRVKKYKRRKQKKLLEKSYN